MSINYEHMRDWEGYTEAHRITIDFVDDWKSFQELIQRGANLWVDAPPEIKEFADLVTNGKILQDYHSQNTDKQKSSKQ